MINKFYSEEYLAMLRNEHSKGEWGLRGGGMYKKIHKLLTQYNTTTFLDYGCGHGSLRKALEKDFSGIYNVIEYDPGIVEKSNIPEPCDFVTCIDVLEHIEEQYVDNVLDDLKRVTSNILYLTVSTREANRVLRGKGYALNAHVTVRPPHWWMEKIQSRFNIINFSGQGSEVEFLLQNGEH